MENLLGSKTNRGYESYRESRSRRNRSSFGVHASACRLPSRPLPWLPEILGHQPSRNHRCRIGANFFNSRRFTGFCRVLPGLPSIGNRRKDSRDLGNHEKDLHSQRPPGRLSGNEGANSQQSKAQGGPRERARASHITGSKTGFQSSPPGFSRDFPGPYRVAAGSFRVHQSHATNPCIRRTVMTNQIISHERSRHRFLNLGTIEPFVSIRVHWWFKKLSNLFWALFCRGGSGSVRQDQSLSDTISAPKNRAKNMVYKE